MRMPLAVAACLVATGCVPWIRHEVVSPAFAGRVTEAGMPVPGATVRVFGKAPGDPAHAARLVAVTDADGRFALPAERDWTFWQYILGPAHHPHFWTLQVADGDAWRVGWSPDGMAPFAVADVVADCDLARDEEVRHASAASRLRGSGICRVEPTTRSAGESP